MIIKIFIPIICMALLCSCGTNGQEESTTEITSSSEGFEQAVYRKISSEEAYAMMEETADFILLDIRTDEEFKEKHIDGAVLIPDYEIADRAETELPDKDMLILIYCRSGRRSANAANELVGMGYTNVYDFGGIIDWQYETVNG